jgi:hypothetical protein
LVGSIHGGRARFLFDYPGGDAPYRVNVLARPDDSAALARFGFRVFGPRWDDVYVMSGLRVGDVPNVSGRLVIGERGRYTVELSNFNPTGSVDYAIWLTGPDRRGAATPGATPPAGA